MSTEGSELDYALWTSATSIHEDQVLGEMEDCNWVNSGPVADMNTEVVEVEVSNAEAKQGTGFYCRTLWVGVVVVECTGEVVLADTLLSSRTEEDSSNILQDDKSLFYPVQAKLGNQSRRLVSLSFQLWNSILMCRPQQCYSLLLETYFVARVSHEVDVNPLSDVRVSVSFCINSSLTFWNFVLSSRVQSYDRTAF